MAHTIHCRDCSTPRQTVFKNTRYCLSCRLLRDLEWLDTEEKSCRADGCSNPFLPLSRKDLYCGACTSSMAATEQRGHCRYCDGKDAALHHGIGICADCVRDAGKRPNVVKGLRTGQTARRKATGWPAVPQPDPELVPSI